MIQPTWVCFDCGRQYGQRVSNLSTWHIDECGVCGFEKPVTQARDFGYLVPDWQDRYALDELKRLAERT